MTRDPLDIPLRVFRVVVAFWLIVAPSVLGFDDLFLRRQDAVAGLLLLAVALVGLLVPGTRVMFLVVGAWLLLSPSFSYEYGFETGGSLVPLWHDRILGLLCLFAGFLPLRETHERMAAPEPVAAPRERRGWSFVHHRPVLFRDLTR